MTNRVEIRDALKLQSDDMPQNPEGSRALIFVPGKTHITLSGYEMLLGNMENPRGRASVHIHMEPEEPEPGQYIVITLRFGNRSQKLIDDYVERIQRVIDNTASVLAVAAERYDTGWKDDDD